MNCVKYYSLLLGTLMIGCSSTPKPPTRAPTQNLLNEFQELPEPSIPPLETVVIPEGTVIPPPENARFWRLDIGDIAPEAGFLFNDDGSAHLVVSHEQMRQQYELVLDIQRESDLARLTRDTRLLHSQLNIDRAKFRLLIQSYDDNIQELHEIIDDQNSPFHDLWTIVGAGAVGVAVGVIVGIIAAQ